MDYRVGKQGRVCVLRFDEGDDFLGELKNVISRENIRCAWFSVIGGLREAHVVTGPREPVMPPDPVWKKIAEAREVLGGGTVFWDDDEPKIHLHAALGHHGDSMTVCVREGTKTYLVQEVVVFEIIGIDATRPWFSEGGFSRLTFNS